MTYKITIEKTEQVRTVLPSQWKLIGTEDNAAYGYTPEVETVQDRTTKVLEQTVDTLNLKAVLCAINGIGG